MIPPHVAKALGPYMRPAFDSWRAAAEPTNAVMVLQGSEGVHIYCMSVVDCQCALAETDSRNNVIANITVALGNPPGEGRFWLLYMMDSCLGLISFRWSHYVSRSFN